MYLSPPDAKGYVRQRRLRSVHGTSVGPLAVNLATVNALAVAACANGILRMAICGAQAISGPLAISGVHARFARL